MKENVRPAVPPPDPATELIEQYFEMDGKRHCIPCMKILLGCCYTCGEEIKADYMEAFDLRFHKECMKCFECSAHLSTQR